LKVIGVLLFSFLISCKVALEKLKKIFKRLLAKPTCTVSESPQAILILSAVAGLSNRKYPERELSFLADATAFLIAKKALDDKNKGGSPTA